MGLRKEDWGLEKFSTNRHTREGAVSSFRACRFFSYNWISAFAGMTTFFGFADWNYQLRGT